MGLKVSSSKILLKWSGTALVKSINPFMLVLLLTAFFLTMGVVGKHTQGEENKLDGVISDEEYIYSHQISEDYSLFWEVNDSDIYIAIRAKTVGWVAIGIGPTFAMQDADMIFGWVNSTGVFAMDTFSIGQFGPHPPDLDLGGTNDIVDFNGTELNEITTFEFKRLLTTGDEYDKSIPTSGKVKMLWALGSSDDFTSSHIERGSFEFFLTGINTYRADFLSPMILGISLSFSLIGLMIFVDSFGRRHQKAENKPLLEGE
ncbi:MAG: DOMON domain-containing protein [Promethearchaeota archaeon]